LAPAPKGMAKI